MNDFLKESVDIHDQSYQNINLQEIVIKNKTYGHVQISASSFFSLTFDNVIFNHVVFTHVDFSNSNFTNCGIHNCQFIDCKMTGTAFAESTIKYCKFQNVLGRYFNINNCKILQLSIYESDLSEARFIDCSHQKLVFENVNLTKAEFNHFSMKEINLTSCIIENILIDPKYLRGSILNYSQMIELAPILGIILK